MLKSGHTEGSASETVLEVQGCMRNPKMQVAPAWWRLLVGEMRTLQAGAPKGP